MSVFVSYSHADERWKDKVVTHLRVLELHGQVELWADDQIGLGENWYDAIRAALESARVALLLVSADSLTSDFILREEVPELLRRRASEGLRLIPVIVRPCAWEDVHWLAGLQVVGHPRPLSTLADHEVETQLKELAREVRRAMPDAARADAGSPSPPSVPPLVPPPPTAPVLERPDADPLDGYELVKVVHTGYYGRVLKCTLRESGETCIVKETDAERVSERALEALATTACANVASPQRVWRTSDKIYEQLPYVGGIALQDAVAPGLGGLEGSMLTSFYKQLRRILETLHRAGIVHRDIHPSNVYLVVKRPSDLAELGDADAESSWSFDTFGEADEAFLVAWVLVDLTFATLADDPAQDEYQHGPYTPLEQQEAAATTASDMYAFGATMFFGSYGVDPPSALDRRVNPQLERDFTDTTGLQPFARYLRRLMALDPDERPPATEHLREGSVASDFVGVLRADDDEYALVDMFPRYTRLVSRREALRTLRQLQRERRDEGWLSRWLDWVSASPVS